MGKERPQSTGRSASEAAAALKYNYGPLLDTILAEVPRVAQAQLETDRSVAPGYAEMELDLLRRFGPQAAGVDADIDALRNRRATEENLALARGAGRDLVTESAELDRLIDPEFYSAREGLGNAINQFLAGEDPNALSFGERAEIERAIGREGAYMPSAARTTENAMMFGRGLQEKRSRFADNVARLTSTIPALRSGQSGIGIATGSRVGRDSSSLGIGGAQTGTGSNAWNLANTALGGNYQLANTVRATTEPMYKQTGGWMSTGGQLIGSIAGGIMGCAIAREVFGNDNPLWVQFRVWLTTQASPRRRARYTAGAQKIARWLSSRPGYKKIVRNWMLKQIGE